MLFEVAGKLLCQSFTPMGGGKVLFGANWHNAGGINVVVGDVVVPLDVVEVHGVGNAVGLIEIFQIAEEVGVVDDPSDIALEVAVVDRIEPNQRDEQAPIGFDELRSEEIASAGKPRVELIQRVEEAPRRALISLLSC